MALLFMLWLGFSAGAFAQTIDRVIAVVGEDVILYSDLRNQYAYMIANGEKDDGTLECQLLETMIIEKLMVQKAKQDSLVVTDAQVDDEIDRRLGILSRQAGSYEELERIYGKSLIEIKSDLRDDVRDQLLAQQMRQQIVGDVRVTPRDVRTFFEQIPTDSLPPLPSEVELFHLAIKPKPNETSKKEAKAMLNQIRQDILAKKVSFEDMAKKHSEDYGSAKQGGFLGEFGRGVMVPEFEEVVFQMEEGEISQAFATDYGFHIIQLHKRLGERITASHILIKPRMQASDDSLALKKLIRIREAIVADSITFQKAAFLWTDDPSSKDCGGCIKNPQTGEYRIPTDLLDADFYLKVDELDEGEVSEASQWITPANEKAFHILFLNKRIPAHIANLNDDYAKIEQAAEQTKQAQIVEEWFKLAKKNVYIEIKYEECLDALKNWVQ